MKDEIYNIAYKYLNRFNFDEDVIQDAMLKLHLNINKFDPDRGTIQTFIFEIAKNIKISTWRKDKEKNTYPISNFVREGNDDEYNPMLNLISSNELSPLDYIISLEEDKNALQRIEMLSDNHKETLFKFIAGQYNGATGTNRSKLRRAIESFKQNKRKEKYILRNIKTGAKYLCSSFTEAAKIAGISLETVRVSLKENRLFAKKTYQIKNI